VSDSTAAQAHGCVTAGEDKQMSTSVECGWDGTVLHLGLPTVLQRQIANAFVVLQIEKVKQK